MARLPSAVVLAGLLALALASSAADTDASPRTDSQGDPLPPGALLRLGTVRWRACANFLAFTPDGKTLMTGEYNYGSDSLVRLWDTTTGKESTTFHVPGAMGLCAALSPDGKTLAVQAIDEMNIIRLVSVPGGKEVRRIDATDEIGAQIDFTRLNFSPDGKMLAAYDGSAIRLFGVETGKAVLRIGVDRIPTAFSPDGKRLACVVEEGALCIVEIPSEKEVFKQRLREDPVVRLNPSFSPDGKRIAWFGEDVKTFALWDIASGKPVRQFRGPLGEVNFLQFSPDGKRIAARYYGDADRWSIRLWDAETGKELWKVVPPNRDIGPVAFSPDGKRLAACDDSDGVVHLWDVETGKEISRVGEHQGSVCSVAFSPDGRTALTGCADRVIRVWDADKGAVTRRIDVAESGSAVSGIAFSRDAKSAAVEGTPEFTDVYDLDLGKKRARLDGGGDPAKKVAFAPDGKTLASNGRRLRIRLWDARSGTMISQFGRDVQGETHFVYSPDGKTLFVGSREYGGPAQIIAWDTAAGKELRKWPMGQREMLDIALSPSGGLIATTELDKVSLWDAVSGQALFDLSPPTDAPSPSWPTSIAFSPDGRTVTTGSEGGPIYLWEITTAMLRAVLVGHRARVTSLNFSPDGARLISGSCDTTALIWDLTGLADDKGPKTLTPEHLASLWDELADADAGKAWRAAWRLAADPAASVPFLQKHLRPAEADADRIAWLLASLDADDFESREAASGELAKLGELAGPAVRRALDGKPSPEARRRLEELARRQGGRVEDAGEARPLRGVEALEHMGTSAARRLLGEMAGGAEGSRLTREAKAALGRLAGRLPGPP